MLSDGLPHSTHVKGIGQVLQATSAGMAFLQDDGDSLEGIAFLQHQPLDFKEILGFY